MRNLQILYKMLKKSNQSVFVIRANPVGRNNLPGRYLNNAGVEKAAQKTCGWGPHGPIRNPSIRLKKRALMTVELCVLYGWWFSSAFSIAPKKLSICDLLVTCLFSGLVCWLGTIKMLGNFKTYAPKRLLHNRPWRIPGFHLGCQSEK